MLRKNQKPFLFTEFQSQLIKRTNFSLRELNRDAVRELQRVGRPGLSNTQYNEAGDFLRVVAIRMISALRIREEIVLAGREQKPDIIRVIFGTQCAACEEKPLTSRDDHEADSREGLEQDPTHHAEIDSLLELASRTEERVSVRCKSRGAHPSLFFAGISRLTLALLRQQRHLRDTALAQIPVIEVQYEPDGPGVCVHCGKPLENGANGETRPTM